MMMMMLRLLMLMPRMMMMMPRMMLRIRMMMMLLMMMMVMMRTKMRMFGINATIRSNKKRFEVLSCLIQITDRRCYCGIRLHRRCLDKWRVKLVACNSYNRDK